MKKKNKKLLEEILKKANINADGDNVHQKLLAERIKLLVERAPMDTLMEATAEIGRFELEDFSNVPIEYNLKSLPFIDGLIDEHREMLQGDEDKGFVLAIWLGAFIGMVQVNEFNGKWQNVSESDWVDNYLFGKIEFDNNLITNPTVTIMKSIEDDQYKVEHFFNCLDVLTKIQLPTEGMNSKKN